MNKLILGTLLLCAACEPQSSQQPSQQVDSQIDSLESAKKAAVGVWTYHAPGQRSWRRLALSDGGAGSCYEAVPTDNDWGKGIPCTWTANTTKNTNTGARLYYLDITTVPWDVIFKSKTSMQEGTAGMDGVSGVEYKKEDAFPFSK
jgi:hypothetical protein